MLEARRPALLLAALTATLLACGPKPTSKPAPAAPVAAPAPAPPTRAEILAASDLPELRTEPVAGDGLGVTTHRLANGMTVYISTDRKEPRFSAWIAVRAGSRHDPADSTGLAHYLEHMVFKGTDEIGTTNFAAEKVHLDAIAKLYDRLRASADEAERKEILAAIDRATQESARYGIANELDQIYAGLGVTGINAFTWHDMTVYIADVPSNRLAAWAEVEGERFRDPSFRLFFPELETVYEEKNKSLDSTGRRMGTALHRALYPDHPYGTQPTIGVVDHLKSPAYTDMVGFFKRWYVPNNMAIVLAGDIDAATALPALERAFGEFEPRPLPASNPGKLTAPSGRVEVEVIAAGGNELILAWPTVATTHVDQPALEVMDLLTSSGNAGILDVDLVMSQRLPRAGSAGAHYREAGHWMLTGTARADQSHADVEALLLGVVVKLKEGAFTQADIDAVVLQAEMREMSELEFNRSRVAKIAGAYIMHQPWSEAATHSARLRKVRTGDVVRVAKHYLTENYVVIKRATGSHSPPKLAKPHITPITIDPARTSAYATAIRAMPATELAPAWLSEGTDYQRLRLPAGELLATHNQINSLFALNYQFDFGSRQQRRLCLALDLMERSGIRADGSAPGLSATELRRTLSRLGTSISTNCATDRVTLEISGIDRNLEESIRLLDQWLRRPQLEPDLLTKLVANKISRRADQVKEPGVLSRALDAYATRDRDSPYLLDLSNRELEKTRVKELGGILARLPDQQHRTDYFGPRPAAAVAPVIALGKNHRKVKAPPPVRYRKTKGVRIYFTDKDVAQSQISVLLPKPPLAASDTPLSELYNGYLGGMEGLIFQEIREARGLAYSAVAGHRPGRMKADQSALSAYVGTQTDKTLDALTLMLSLLREPPLQPQRLAKTQAAIIQRYRASRASPRWVNSLVRSWDDLGLATDPRSSYFARHQQLDGAALTEFAGRFASGDVIISIMGDRKRIDFAALAKLGKIVTVKPEQLFSY